MRSTIKPLLILLIRIISLQNKRLQYIVQILHGDIPEEIFTYDEDDSTGSTSLLLMILRRMILQRILRKMLMRILKILPEEDEFAYGDVPGTSTEDSAEASDEETD